VAGADETPGERPAIEVKPFTPASSPPPPEGTEGTAAPTSLAAPTGKAASLGIGGETAPSPRSQIEGEGLATMIVSTYASADVANPQESELKARTTISPTGDIETVLPAEITVEDQVYVETHQAVVVEAIQARTAYLAFASRSEGEDAAES
jgi:hypothetical protein